MKAVGFKKYGGVEVIEQLDVGTPQLGENDVLIHTSYTSINRLDILVRSGYHGLKLPMPHIPGSDVVGRIEAIGSSVQGFSEGELVVANTVFGCGRCAKCAAGDEVSCREWKVHGMHTDGSYAQLVRVPASTLVRPPKELSEEDLACIPISLSISWRSIVTLGKGKEGQTIVIRGASGNVGIFATMIAKALGMRVIAISRNEEKRARLKQLGADAFVDSSLGKEETAKQIMDLTEGTGADLTIDPFGATLGESILFTGHGGKVAVFGTVRGTESTVSIPGTYLKNITVFGTHNENKAQFEEALRFIAQKKIKPIIATRLPLERAAEGQDMLEKSEPFGKILLKT
ncbi:MAG: zinc-binding dehydrogenase [Candidatus Micrarchaeota archaeon]|nr:zinc-binding dehydrogenase [Candidatus Micrarchaeota archaeon]